MIVQNEDPHFINGILSCFLLAGLGHGIHELMIMIPFIPILHYLMAGAKFLSWVGSGLVGITTFYKFVKNLFKNGHK